MSQQKELKDLGYANSWKETPEIVERCKCVGWIRNIGRCLNEYGCSICGYKYIVDSSD